MRFEKLKKGDKVAIVSPSFAAPGKWPHVHELGLKRLREVFELEPVELPTTRKIGASNEERSRDLIDAFQDPGIKAVIASLGGNDQVTYIKNLPPEPFVQKSFNIRPLRLDTICINGTLLHVSFGSNVEFCAEDCICMFQRKSIGFILWWTLQNRNFKQQFY